MNFFTWRRAVVACSVLLILVTSSYSWFGTLVTVRTQNDQLLWHCILDDSESPAVDVFYYFSAILTVVCPVVTLVFLNTTIIVRLWRSLSMKQNTTKSNDSSSGPRVSVNPPADTGDRCQRNIDVPHMSRQRLTIRRKQGVK